MRLPALALLLAPLALTGCSSMTTTATPIAEPGLSLAGNVHGGQQPVVGATIQLYQVGTAGDRSASVTLLSPPVTTNSNGAFNITNPYSCSPANALVYLVATQGNPGLTTGSNNPNLAEMAVLGPCDQLTSSTFTNVTEVTTVAAVAALYPYMRNYTSLGSGTYDAANLLAAFSLAAEYANTVTGSSPGSGVPAGYQIPTAEINTIANILSACVNSPGGAAGDGSLCGQLFSALTPPNGLPPTDTIQALLDLMNNPTLGTSTIFGLSGTTPAFQPQLTSQPTTFAVTPTPTGSVSLQYSSTSVAFPATAVGFTSAVQTVTVTNNGQGTVNFTDFSLTGANATDFSQVSDCTSLIPGASCQLQVTVTPAASGSRVATVSVPSTAPYAPQTIALSVTAGAPAAGPMSVRPSSLNYTVGGTVQDVTLTNNGATALTIRNLSIATHYVYYTIQYTSCGKMLAANSSCVISIRQYYINSVAAAHDSATLTIDDDAAGGVQTVSLTQTDTTYVISSNYSSLAVGIAEPSNEIYVYPVSSTATASFVGTAGGPDPNDFVQQTYPQNATGPLTGCTGAAAGATCSFDPIFTPTGQGIRSTHLGPSTGYIALSGDYYYNDPGANFGLSGSSETQPYQEDQAYWQQVLLFDATVDSATATAYGTSAIPAAQYAYQVSIYNYGTTTLNFNSFPILAANASYFSAVGSCTNLAPQASCTITVLFHANTTRTGQYKATLVAQDTVSGVTQTLPIYVVLGLVGTPSSLTFTAPLGTTSASQTVTVTDGETNGVPDPLTVTNVGPAIPIQLSSPVCSSASGSPTCTFTAAYAPTLSTPIAEVGSYLQVTDTITGVILYAASYTTNPTAPANTPVLNLYSGLSTFDFGAQSINSSTTSTIIISNLGTAPLTLSGISAQGAVNGNFTQTSNCPATLDYPTDSARGTSACAVTVTFTPSVTGSQSATLQVLSNAAPSPNTLTLTGTGQ